MNVEAFTRRLARLRLVATHIDAHLTAPVCLDELADIAHLSRFHFERVFKDYAGESPLARVRRLRLLAARRRIEEGYDGSMLQLALESGYASAEAFSRAFRAVHEISPSQVHALAQQAPAVRVVDLAPLEIQYVPYEGPLDEALQPFEELRARAMLCNIPRQRRKGWSVLLEGGRDHWSGVARLQAGLLSDPLGTRVKGLDSAHLPGGRYAVVRVAGSMHAPSLDTLGEVIARQCGLRVTDGPVLRSFKNVTYLPSALERCFDLYLPVA
jgi:AraC family transcriptional regulator